MRLKLDENIPNRVEELFRAAGHDVDTIVSEGLSGAQDADVAAAAKREGRMLLTLDHDFADITAYPPGSNPGMIIVRLPEPRPSMIVAAVSGLFARHDLETLVGCTTIVQLGAIRVRRPTP